RRLPAFPAFVLIFDSRPPRTKKWDVWVRIHLKSWRPRRTEDSGKASVRFVSLPCAGLPIIPRLQRGGPSGERHRQIVSQRADVRLIHGAKFLKAIADDGFV